MIKDGTTHVLFAPITDTDISLPIYPSERYMEVLRCKSDKVKHEKYLVWKLLERAVKKYFNIEFANLQFAKTDNGKWICPDFFFSLSHTDGCVCVAISPRSVGVDIERVRRIKEGLKDKILTEREREVINELPENERERALLSAWVKKESIFKKGGGEALLPSRIETNVELALCRSVFIKDSEYMLSVAYETENIEIEYTEEI